ncbi:MAG TPA: hypothetical protein VIS48_04810 [Candidatus Kryptonia bacterium]
MSYVEQRKMIDSLRYKTAKMPPKDKYDYEMFAKRDKDDEDLDLISMKRLRELYEKYSGYKKPSL